MCVFFVKWIGYIFIFYNIDILKYKLGMVVLMILRWYE